VDWMKGSRTAGLGHSQRYVQSSIVCLSLGFLHSKLTWQFSLGSGVNFDYNLSEIPVSSTIHNIRLSLCQTTKTDNGNKEEAIFTLFSRGSNQTSEHVWRGEVGRSWDAQSQKSKGKQSMGSVPQAALPGVAYAPSSLRIRTKARLPTPINGAVPTSPRLLDNRLARVTHHVRVETFYSVLGEDASGSALPMNPKSKDGRPQEGIIRRTWVDHEVVIGACCITPENILVPTYSSSTGPTATDGVIGTQLEHRSTLQDFDMPKTCTRTMITERGRQTSEHPENSTGKAQLTNHAQCTDSRCLCFHHDPIIAEMIGSLEKSQANQVSMAQIDIGGIEKSLYISSITQSTIRVRI